jgi:hypothetical protein
MKITVATIRANDSENGRIIPITLENGEILADGSDAMLGTPRNGADAMQRIFDAWGRWGTFEMRAILIDGGKLIPMDA